MKLAVVGGGTAGWLSALALKKAFPDFKISVFASEEIGILGAGEGSTPNFVKFIMWLGIDIAELIQNCEATVKQSIEFSNWSGDNSSFHHTFVEDSQIKDLELFPHLSYDSNPLLLNGAYPEKIYAALSNNLRQEDYELSAALHDKGKVPFGSVKESFNYVDGLAQFYVSGPFAFHFNATKLAEFLKRKAIERGVEYFDSVLVDANVDEANKINGLIFKDDTVECDFVVDCTGFQKKILKNTYNPKWISFSEILPCNSAQAFFKENTDPNLAITRAIAMPYGWKWEIPLQTRIGCGYVYDERLASNEEIRKAILECDEEVDFGKQFNFEPGYLEEMWVENCLSVGLSSSFVEPLEATSIMQTVNSLEYFIKLVAARGFDDSDVRNEFNQHNRNTMESIADFLFLHYYSNRSDTTFWEKFSYKNLEKRPRVKLIVDRLTSRLPGDAELIDNNVFKSCSFSTVIIGNKIVSPDQIRSHRYSEIVKQRLDFTRYFEYINSSPKKHINQKVLIEVAKSISYPLR